MSDLSCECPAVGRDHGCVLCLAGCACPCFQCAKARKQLPYLEALAKAAKKAKN